MNNKKKGDIKFYIIFGLIIIVYFSVLVLHATTLMSMNADLGIVEALDKSFTRMFTEPFSVRITAQFFEYLGITILILAATGWYLYTDYLKNKHYKTGAESGTAHWETDLKTYNTQYTEPYGQPSNNGPNNMILTKDVFLGMDSRHTRRNNNIIVIGGSGSGKTRFFVKPNLLQANCNYVVTDPSGELLSTTGKFLENQGYEIKVFNLVEMAKSNQYNPFHYIRDDLGVLMMINCLIRNTNPEGKSGGDPFWEKSETALLQALCFYLIKYCPESQRNFTSVMKLLRAAEIDENDPNRKSKLDRIFDEVAYKDPNSIALKQYLTFKMGAGKTLKSILISCSVRLTVFNMKQIENLTRIDTIDLGGMGTGKKALFVIIPAADSTYNFLVSMMYSQLFETLYFIAETQCKNQRLERPVRFLLDEFVNIGQIPEFTKKLATMRKYDISCSVILQNLAQIKTMYKDDWETIIGNCDTFIFLGGQEYATLEYVSKELGKTTITVKNRSTSIGKNKSASHSYNQTARDLMTPDEIMTMPKDECICIVNGLHPFYGKKYDYTAHPQYKNTGDANPDLIYVNERDNSVVYSKEMAEVQIEKEKAMAAAKAEIYQKTYGGFKKGVVPATKAFANVQFNTYSAKRPEDIEEMKPERKTTSDFADKKIKEEVKENNKKDEKIDEKVTEKALDNASSDTDTSDASTSQEVWDFTSFT